MKPTPSEPRESALLEHRPQRIWVYVPISAAIGVVITIIVGLSNPSALNPLVLNLVVGAFVGAVIGASAIYGELLLMKVVRPRRPIAVQMVRILGYGVGGALGYTVAGLTIDWVLGGQATWNGGSFTNVTIAALVFGAFSVGIGLVFQMFERLRARLEESVAQLKEAEFAAKELITARDIQRRLLPPERLSGDGFSLRALNRAASVVAGDFYDYLELPGGQLLFAVGDVSGKGMGASLIMATVKARLPLMLSLAPLDEVALRLNRQLRADSGPREFVALLLGRFDPHSGRLEWVNSGLPDPLLIPVDGSGSRELASAGDRLPLGLRADVAPAVASRDLQLGDRVLFYTDGLPEELGADGEPRGYEWLRERVDARMQEGSHDPARALLADVLAEDLDVAPDQVPSSAGVVGAPRGRVELVVGAQEPLAGAGQTSQRDDCTVLLLEWCAASQREAKSLEAREHESPAPAKASATRRALPSEARGPGGGSGAS